ncbi:Gfo/Idh/MocA family protein [Gracilimonas mengyeensis]|uniref:Predicted dehydrogenase n=1 Tax=Gracilimonas mengyeensis TaxID=1302730 RepID=A0A521FN63_9BACT|nr:Gfo/Idh/MocA family oxidoreductase [Gracilimonas mengyeensis]SMO97589.1 Predicted dehydrogenase [Gracilimonas mengyeensis]
MQNRKLRMGMIGGGVGSFIGGVHRVAANLDGQIELVCGAFSRDPEKSARTGKELFLDEGRVYGSYKEMIKAEKQLPKGDRMDFVSIVTPNHVHADPALLALDNGFPVIIDKPLCFDMQEAKALQAKVKETRLPFALTHTYTGYPMVKQARKMVEDGELGPIKKITVEYPQGWLSQKLEADDNKQASWRTDPTKSGKAGAYGDIGTHAANMAEYVSGLKINKVLSQLSKIVEGRLLDDDASALLEFEGGVPGVLACSQVSAGEENNIKIRVYGEKGGLEWQQEDNNTLKVKWQGKPDQIYRTGVDNTGYLSETALANSRVPAGHPEGYLEAFANIYRNFGMHLRAHDAGENHDMEIYDYPDVDEGVHGMSLVDAVVESTERGNIWVEVKNN